VFDILGEPDFASVVPGGRVEPGETIAETAARELAEETGVDIRVLQELGVLEQESWRVPGIQDENHFVHAVPVGGTEDEWVHEGVVRCRWIPLVAGIAVYGEHGAFLDRLL
jgi:8-oxo-dGTP pyrophosphatase MutT (NUDIX family)